jgi:uncharacterized membrane protein (Fun14 family)
LINTLIPIVLQTSIENIGAFVATIGLGFFVGVLIGYALKKVVKIVAIVVGLFFAGLAALIPDPLNLIKDTYDNF